MTVPVYIAEASPPHLRGQLVTVNTLFITAGQFTASLIDGAFSYLQRDGWRSGTETHTHTHRGCVQLEFRQIKQKRHDSCLHKYTVKLKEGLSAHVMIDDHIVKYDISIFSLGSCIKKSDWLRPSLQMSAHAEVSP